MLRGTLVCDLLAGELPLNGARVLDAGCGGGGTSIALTMRGARVTATDRNLDRLAELRANHPGITAREADLHALPFDDDSFDGAVLQDVIEHVADPAAVLREISRVLRQGGVLYLSTPNRDALPNLVADPHFGLPLISRKKRPALREALRRWRPQDAERDDLAQLFPETQLLRLLREAGFHTRFVNRAVAQRLFREPESVVWSDLHLAVVQWLCRTRVHHILLPIVRDEAGILNRLLNPTFYLICRKDDA